MKNGGTVVIRGGRVVDAKARRADALDILIVDDTIREVGRPGMAAPDGARVVDAKNRALIPGLINAHTHSHSALAKAIDDRWTLELLLHAGPWITGNRSLEEKHLSTKIAAVEMVLKGCTACYDLIAEVPVHTADGLRASGQAYADVGMRALIAPMMADITFYQAVPGLMDALPPADRKRAEAIRLNPYKVPLDVCRQVLRDWPFDREQIALALAPTIPLLCTDEFLTAARDLAREHDIGFHTHMAESRVWAHGGVRKYNESLTAHFDRLGILGPKFTAAHAVWLNRDDIRRMGDKGANVAHNPGSNLRLGSGIADVRTMIESGVNVGIGTDSATCGDHLSMVESMRLASFVSRVRDRDFQDWIGTDEALTMATEGSAKALGFEGRIGRIAAGFKADIVFLDLNDISFVPLNNIVHQLVHCADSKAIDKVMIGGRMVVEGGRVTTVDYDALVRDVEKARAGFLSRTLEHREWATKLEGVVGTYCSGFGREYKHSH